MTAYFVTGGAGFIGSHIAMRLLRDGQRVRVLDDLSTGRKENLDAIRAAAPKGSFEFVEGDIRAPETCRGAAILHDHLEYRRNVRRSAPESQDRASDLHYARQR